ncbi:MAG TPA: response regulator transcription factor [Patescibacteria group bacterium]|nr:response regulator transcription factor [Patescibacteria group bacterium]
MRILLIDDDLEASRSVKKALRNYYVVESAKTYEDGEYKAQVNGYDSLLIDYTLPDMDGIQLCKKLRDGGFNKSIIILTGNDEIKNKVAALNSGADDYITRPFDLEELRARIESTFRRYPENTHSDVLIVGDLSLDLSKRKAIRSGKELALKRKEFDILEYLMRNSGRVVTRPMIFDTIWDSNDENFTNVIDVHIKYLRDLVDRDSNKKLIKTVHGYGYKIEA